MRWFKHESDARNSLKLRKVRRKYGADGYAIYWFCLEAIAYGVDKDNLTFDLKEDAETIGFELSVQESRVVEIMNYMISVGLFESSNNTITCLKFAERLDKSMTNSPKMRAWLEDKSTDKVSQSVMTLADSVNTCAELDKNRKDKNRKEIKESNKSSNEDAIQSVIDLYNQAIKDNKPNWPRCTTTNDKRKKLVKEALKLVKQRAIETGQSPVEYLGNLFDVMASDEYYSGYKKSAKYPNGYERPFDLNFRQDELMRAMDKFITMSEQA